MTLRCVFFGTPEVAVDALGALVAHPEVLPVLVVTNPDRPRGRSGRAQPPPVKEAAAHWGIPVRQPPRPHALVEELLAARVDVGAVVAYGALLPPAVLTAPRLGCVNVHFSLLPRWRGAAPVQHALRHGDTVTGVTTFLLDEGMDTGPVIAQRATAIEPSETAGELFSRLSILGSALLPESLLALAAGVELTPQDDRQATYAPKISRADVALEFDTPAASLVNVIRSANPRPGAHSTFRGRTVKIWRAHVGDRDSSHVPGQLVSASDLTVACGEGTTLVIDELQVEGKRATTGPEFIRGYQPRAGEWFGQSGERTDAADH